MVLHYIGPQVFQQENSIQPSLPQPFRIYEFVILVLFRLQQFSLRERYFYFEFLLLSVLRRNSFLTLTLRKSDFVFKRFMLGKHNLADASFS